MFSGVCMEFTVNEEMQLVIYLSWVASNAAFALLGLPFLTWFNCNHSMDK